MRWITKSLPIYYTHHISLEPPALVGIVLFNEHEPWPMGRHCNHKINIKFLNLFSGRIGRPVRFPAGRQKNRSSVVLHARNGRVGWYGIQKDRLVGSGKRHDLHENQLRDASWSIRREQEQNIYRLDENREFLIVCVWDVLNTCIL